MHAYKSSPHTRVHNLTQEEVAGRLANLRPHSLTAYATCWYTYMKFRVRSVGRSVRLSVGNNREFWKNG